MRDFAQLSVWVIHIVLFRTSLCLEMSLWKGGGDQHDITLMALSHFFAKAP